MKYQMRCPKCNHEFTYDNGYLDRNIAQIGMEIASLMKQLAEYKTLPRQEQKQRKKWRDRTNRLLAEKQEEIKGLKEIRKVSDQQIKRMEYQIFKNLVKEQYGEEVYHRLLDEATKELEAYKVSGLMAHEYSRAGSKSNVTGINKL